MFNSWRYLDFDMKRIISIIFVTAIFVHPAIAQDDTATAVPMGKVNEHFDKTAKSAGGRLVGLSLGLGNIAKFNPGNVWVTMPPSAEDVICVTGVSRDGLYWTRTPYQISSAHGPGGQVKLSPFTDKYEAQLLAYDSDDVAVFAFAADGPGCFVEKAVILPMVTKGKRGGSPEISAHVNSGNFAVSILVDVGQGAKEMVCRQDQERIAFDWDCSLPVTLGDAPINGTLILRTDDGLSVDEEHFLLRLPAR